MIKWRNELLQKYVSMIDEACGEGREFIITLKYSEKDRVLEKIFDKCHLDP